MLPKPKIKRQIYFDHASTTYTDLEVVKVMQPFFAKKFENPSSLYGKGREANNYLNKSRKTIADIIHAVPNNIYFTSGGSESNNLALIGCANANKENGKHIITTKIEHHSVLIPLAYLEKNGWKITYLDVDEQGFINIKQLFKNIQKDTVLISIMHANNEMGSIQNISETGRELLKYRKQNNTCFPYFHTDACQSAGFLNLDVEKLHVDLVTINSSKIYGPKGVGMLYIRNKVKIEPIIFGGHQENRLRAGTQNMPGIVGFAKAFELASKNKEKESKRLRILTEYFWKQIKNTIPKVILNGPEIGDQRLPNNLNITFLDIEGEAMLLYLDEYGIMCGTGSACTSDSLEPSHVLTAMGRPYEHSHGSIRFSLGKCNNKKDIDYTMKYLPKIIKHLREMSPVNLKIKNI